MHARIRDLQDMTKASDDVHDTLVAGSSDASNYSSETTDAKQHTTPPPMRDSNQAKAVPYVAHPDISDSTEVQSSMPDSTADGWQLLASVVLLCFLLPLLFVTRVCMWVRTLMADEQEAPTKKLSDNAIFQFSCDSLLQRTLDSDKHIAWRCTPELLQTSIAEVRCADPAIITIASDGFSSRLNSCKLYVEDFVGERIDWWPMGPAIPPLKSGYTRIHWKCVSVVSHCSSNTDHAKACGEMRFVDTPKDFAIQICEIATTTLTGGAPPQQQQQQSNSQPPPTIQSPAQQTISTPVGVQSQSPQGSPQAVNPIPAPGGQSGQSNGSPNEDSHIFVIVNNGNILKLAQWLVDGDGNDDVFFKRLRAEYLRARGYLRYGLFAYSHCEFYQVRISTYLQV